MIARIGSDDCERLQVASARHMDSIIEEKLAKGYVEQAAPDLGDWLFRLSPKFRSQRKYVLSLPGLPSFARRSPRRRSRSSLSTRPALQLLKPRAAFSSAFDTTPTPTALLPGFFRARQFLLKPRQLRCGMFPRGHRQ